MQPRDPRGRFISLRKLVEARLAQENAARSYGHRPICWRGDRLVVRSPVTREAAP